MNAETTLRWAYETFDRVAVVASFQAESSVIIDLASKIRPDVRVLTLDTGRLPQETHDQMDREMASHRIRLHVQAPDPDEVAALAAEHGTNPFRRSVELRRRELWHHGPERLGHLDAERPEVLPSDGSLDAEAQHALGDRCRASLRDQAGQLAWLCVAERTGRVGRRGRELHVARDNLKAHLEERVEFDPVPDCEGQAPTRLEHPQHLAQRGDRVGEEHGAQPADDGVEAAGSKRQRAGRASSEGDVAQASPARLALRHRDHVRHRVRADDRARGPAHLRDAERRLAGTRCDVERRLSRPQGGVLDQGVREGREHRPDHRGVLVPVGCGLAPCPQAGDLLFLRVAHARSPVAAIY